jgi:hypothetical protein
MVLERPSGKEEKHKDKVGNEEVEMCGKAQGWVQEVRQGIWRSQMKSMPNWLTETTPRLLAFILDTS